MKIKDLLEKIDDPKLAYHDDLNPKLWDESGGSYELKGKVKQKLVKIADEFVEALGLPKDQVKDYVFTGSNANYNWTKLSDIDLHVIVDMKAECEGCKAIDVKDCIDTKKTLWNDRHDITIYGYPVELYASDVTERIVGDAGVYSLLSSKWIRTPEQKNISMDSKTIKAKADDIAQQIDDLIDSKTDDKDAIKALTGKIANYRKAGLAKGGEFSVENLVFKALRNNGYIDKIRKYAVKAQDHTLSLDESLDTDVELFDVDDQPDFFEAFAKINGRKICFQADYQRLTLPSGGKVKGWSIEFSERGHQHSGGKAYHLTGAGGELQVASMVMKCMKMIEKKPNANVFYMIADKTESRRDAYVKILKKQFPNYEIMAYESDEDQYDDIYMVKKGFEI